MHLRNKRVYTNTYIRKVYVYMYNSMNTSLYRSGVAINEAITNAEDKLESNKAVKMISGPKRISMWNLNETDPIYINI